MSTCCPTLIPPCLYGNREQSVTKTCTTYYMNSEPSTATVAENTIFTECTSKSNDIALDLANDEVDDITYCNDECCYSSLCLSLLVESDIQYLEYFSVTEGVLFSQDVTICATDMNICGLGLGNFVSFRPGTSTGGPFVVGTVSVFGNPDLGSTCTKLSGGVVYGFTINRDGLINHWNFRPDQQPRYSLGWDCNIPCPPEGNTTEITLFPAGIAFCNA